MARKKRLTPKDKKIQTLESDLAQALHDVKYWQQEAESNRKALDSAERINNKKQAELRDQRGQVEGFLKTMTDSVRQLHDVVRAYGQPFPEPKPVRNRNTGEWEDRVHPTPPTPDRFIGYIEGSLQRIAIEGTHMQAPLVHVGMDMAAPRHLKINF